MFQSTHPRGVRHATSFSCISTVRFQSTHPRGVRPGLFLRPANANQFQSTHPRGVRPHAKHPSPHMGTSFNPRTRVGCDYQGPELVEQSIQFQSTHPRGVRRNAGNVNSTERCFNPRTRVGCDIYALVHFVIPAIVSIHAPAWGATFLINCNFTAI